MPVGSEYRTSTVTSTSSRRIGQVSSKLKGRGIQRKFCNRNILAAIGATSSHRWFNKKKIKRKSAQESSNCSKASHKPARRPPMSRGRHLHFGLLRSSRSRPNPRAMRPSDSKPHRGMVKRPDWWGWMVIDFVTEVLDKCEG